MVFASSGDLTRPVPCRRGAETVASSPPPFASPPFRPGRGWGRFPVLPTRTSWKMRRLAPPNSGHPMERTVAFGHESITVTPAEPLWRFGHHAFVVGLPGLEPGTFGPPDRRANQAAPQPVKGSV